MKNRYLLLVSLLLLTVFSQAQFVVSATATNPNVCLGGSSQLNALASPISYTGASITYNPLPALGVNVLCTAGALDVNNPVPPAANPSGTLFLDDSRWDNIDIPFTFTYFGNNYTKIHISTNGWMGFGITNSTPTGLGQTIPSTAVANNVIFAMLADLTFKTASGGTIEYYTDGFMPGSRKFVVMWNGCRFLSGTNGGNVQIILYEATNVIEIHTSVIPNTTVFKTQGVENSGGTAGVASAGKNNTQNWGAATTAYRFTPENITYSWSPATGLSSTSGQSVTATPPSTTIYTITATNAVSTVATNTVTVAVNPASFTLAGIAGGSSISHFINVDAGGTYYRDMSSCNLIAHILPSGASPVNNSINTSIKVDASATKRGTSDLYLARKYDIEPVAFASTATATIKMYFLQSEFDNFNLKALDSGHKLLPTGPADAPGISNFILRQFHGTGTAPGNYSGSTVDMTTATSGFTLTWNSTYNYWEATVPVNGFSGFYVTSAKASPIPVKLIYFTGTQNTTQHLLDWKVNCTSTSASFEIERSSDGMRFSKIGGFTATQTRCDQPFDFTVDNTLPGINYYRIKVIDVDGKYYYTQIVTLISKTKGFVMTAINPTIVVNENAIAKINAGEKTKITLVISDFSGRLISKKEAQLQMGANNIEIETNQLTAGAYQVTAYTTDAKPQTLRFVKQ